MPPSRVADVARDSYFHYRAVLAYQVPCCALSVGFAQTFLGGLSYWTLPYVNGLESPQFRACDEPPSLETRGDSTLLLM